MKRSREEDEAAFADWYGGGEEETLPAPPEIPKTAPAPSVSPPPPKPVAPRPVVPDDFGAAEFGSETTSYYTEAPTVQVSTTDNFSSYYPSSRSRPWKRSTAPPLDPATQDLTFQHTETTYGIDHEGKPILRVWGCTASGNSVLMETKTFEPYFYAKLDSDMNVNDLRAKLEEYLHQITSKRNAVDTYITRIERVQKRSMCGWHRHRPLETMYKFYMTQPGHVSAARDALENSNDYVTGGVHVKTFEANVPYELRYMVDQGIVGCGWIRLRAGTYKISGNPTHGAQYVVSVANLDDIHNISVDEPGGGDLAPMR